jgi:hypothetical protein
MYFIAPHVDDVDLGATHSEGSLSVIWKTRLHEVWLSDREAFVSRLLAGGIRLENVSAAIERWSKPSTNVIHAPQYARNFEILIHALEISNLDEDAPKHRNATFWRRAWEEIKRSRGEAIQAGFQEHEIVEEELLLILANLLPKIRELAATEERFTLGTPASSDIRGAFEFHRVCGVEEGFRAPHNQLRAILPLDVIEQWRG